MKLFFIFILFYFSISLKEWKSYNAPSGPLLEGISAGLFADGVESYVGRGTVSGQLAPGTLLIVDSVNRTAALYMEYGGKEYNLTSNVHYFAKSSNCNYIWVASSGKLVVPNAIAYKASGFTFYVGRIFYQVLNAWYVGKIPLELGLLYYAKGKTISTYEVLVCQRR